MVPTATIINCVIVLISCLLLPPAALLLYQQRNKGGRTVSAWLLGAAGFFVTQMLIRVPILTLLQTTPAFQAFSANYGFLYAFSLAFTAGLFELAGRFVVAKIMQKNLTFPRSIAAGLGHGGIEAMVLVGMSYVSNILYIFMINAGTFDAMVAEAAGTGVDVSALWQLKDTLLNTHPAMYLVGIYERLLSVICHLAMSLVVCYGIRTGKPLKACLICLGIHTLIDLSVGINMLTGAVLTQTMAYIIIYSILTAAAVASVLIIRSIRRRWRETEVNHV